jgi:hypothetical protein
MAKRLNPLVFPIPPSLKATYSGQTENQWLFDVSRLGLSGSYLVLWVAPDDYKPDVPAVEVVTGYGSSFVNPDGDTYQIQATIKDGHEAALKIVEELAQSSYSGDTVTPLTLYDYHRAEQGATYTERTGVIWIESPTGSFRGSNQNLSQGFNLVFKEV